MARIIVIDDNDAARVTMRRVLEKAGHQVLEASDGDAGLKLLAEIGVTLVITDIFMPGQDGICRGRTGSSLCVGSRRNFPACG